MRRVCDDARVFLGFSVLKMQVPSFLYGRWAEVRSKTARKLTAFRRGATLPELVDGWIDTADSSAPLALMPPGSGQTAFHCYAFIGLLGAAVPKTMPDEAFATFFEQALQSPWSFTGLLGDDGRDLISLDQSRVMPFLDAAVAHWPVFDSVGARFCFLSAQVAPLWALPSNIKFALGKIGLIVPEVQAPLPEGGLRTLVERGMSRTAS